MKIAYVITRSDWGGAQSHVFDLLRYASQFEECHLIVGEEGELTERVRNLPVSVWHVPTLIQPIHPFYDCLALRDILRVLRKIKPDLVHTHSSKAGFIGRFASRLADFPSIFTAHGWAFTEGVSAFRKKISIPMERVAAKISKKIICVSEYDRELALQYEVAEENKLITIHNGISEQYSINNQDTGDTMRVVMVARFSAQKDHNTLIRAAANISSPVEFILVGHGELMEQSRLLVNQLHVADRISFLGMQRDIPGILSKSDVFVLTSHYEGFPISILEAMRAGLPVIASDVGGVKEAVIDGVTGFLVPRGDVQAVQNRLEVLANNPIFRKQMGEAGRKRFLEHFTKQKMIEKTFSVYEELV
ncbi:glycosyltransferase family 4 protein [Aneurinibacillus terranovensis]|uniref:glycosyltransferase family 4 protein n=1 Tax=Aneurinibacillus terranovensis TaxID=278991 RepID=UPI000406C837|nr:glycosyltransferase family 4 protein [Aneurinibacillus terranovensis]